MPLQKENIVLIIVIISAIFMVAGLFMFLYITIFNERKKRHKDEKQRMRTAFDNELLRAEIEAQEQTRQHLAGDLHDNIGQLLSLTSVILGSVNAKDEQRTGRKVADAHELILRSISDLRQLSRLIHGEQLLRQGLLEAIRQEVDWLRKSGRFAVDFIPLDKEITVPDPEKDLLVFRLFQESLSNILKHAEASKVAIIISGGNGALDLTIRDNGVGFDARKQDGMAQGLGLQHMQRRVKMLNGSMDIQSGADKGTTLHFIIPYLN